MSNDFQTVATFWNPNEAQLARALIESEGIQVVLMGYEAISSDWLLSNAIGGVQLQVLESQVDRAVAILEDSGPFGRRSLVSGTGEGEVDDGSDGEGFEDSREEVDDDRAQLSEKEESVDRFLKTSILSWIFFPLSLYALWLLWSVLDNPEPVGEKYTRKVWIGTLIQLLPVLLTLVVLVRFWLAYVIGGVAR
ncbi:MAG: putative signal transducing protein [Pirellula sp.]